LAVHRPKPAIGLSALAVVPYISPVSDRPDFVLEWTINYYDVRNALLWQLWRGARTKWVRLLVSACSLFGLTLLVLRTVGVGHSGLVWPIALTICPLVLSVAAGLQAIMVIQNNPALKAPIHLKVSHDGIDATRAGINLQTDWSGFASLHETRRSFLLRYQGTRSYLLIPRRAPGTQSAHFRRYVHEHLGQRTDVLS
jgi:hypothetical protein